MTNDCITILIPTYNREKYIKECIESILNQTHSNLQIIVYDDGSTDKTVPIASSIQDPRITIHVGNTHRGVSFARNKLLEICSTKIACWQDSDDLSNIYRIKHQYKTLKNKNAVVVYSRCFRFNNDSYINTSESPKVKTNSDSWPMAGAMFMVDKSPRFNNNVTLGAEDGLWRRQVAKAYKDKVVLFDEVLYYVRFHSTRIGTQKNLEKNREEKAKTNKAVFEEIEKLKICRIHNENK